MLTDACGSLEYSAPEVLRRKYNGEAADVWSSGIVLAVMLTGDLPWSSPTLANPAYFSFVYKRVSSNEPWTRVCPPALALLRTILVDSANTRRATLRELRANSWLNGSGGAAATTIKIEQNAAAVSLPQLHFGYIASQLSAHASSQPPSSGGDVQNRVAIAPLEATSMPPSSIVADDVSTNVAATNRKLPRYGLPSLSQPVSDTMMLSLSQAGTSQGVSYVSAGCTQRRPLASRRLSLAFQHPLQTFIRRVTRFCVQTTVFELCDLIEEAASSLGCGTSYIAPQQILVSAMLRGRAVKYFVHIYELNEANRPPRQLVDARWFAFSRVAGATAAGENFAAQTAPASISSARLLRCARRFALIYRSNRTRGFETTASFLKTTRTPPTRRPTAPV